MKKFLYLPLFLILLLLGCSAETGTLAFYANGEAFVSDGFISKDGWAIQFDHVNVTLTDVAAYQTNPPFDAASGDMPDGERVVLSGTKMVDLKSAPLVEIGTITAAIGHYNAISWEMTDNSVQLMGSAEKAGQTIVFDLIFDQPFRYACGEFVGDERKGFVNRDSTSSVELTFHFDHVFGDSDTDPTEALNVGALGFDPLAALASDDTLIMTQSDLSKQLDSADYDTLIDTLATLGHVGEGHCFESSGGYTGEK